MNNLIKATGSLFLIAVGATIAYKGGKFLYEAITDSVTREVPKVIVVPKIISIHKEVIKDAVEKTTEAAAEAVESVQENTAEAVQS